MELAGKIVLITGSTDGLGKLVARHAAQRGAFVILHGRNERIKKARKHYYSFLAPAYFSIFYLAR
jgi:NAD(P)-dependent dehydrogenase (short-subunit alcohol dehydrogenase family)